MLQFQTVISCSCLSRTLEWICLSAAFVSYHTLFLHHLPSPLNSNTWVCYSTDIGWLISLSWMSTAIYLGNMKHYTLNTPKDLLVYLLSNWLYSCWRKAKKIKFMQKLICTLWWFTKAHESRVCRNYGSISCFRTPILKVKFCQHYQEIYRPIT